MTLPERIDRILVAGPRSLFDLAMILWPPRACPRAWNTSTRGGPHAWARTLGAAIRRGKFRTVFEHPGPAGTKVYARRRG